MLNPYLLFGGNAFEAFTFYKSVFGGGFSQVVRFRDMPDTSNIDKVWLDSIAHIALPLVDGVVLMGSDAPPVSGAEAFIAGNNFALNIEPESADEARRLFEALSLGGKVTMDISKTDWSEIYGQLTDQFGVQWMVNLSGSEANSSK
jgi:PhnB protein